MSDDQSQLETNSPHPEPTLPYSEIDRAHLAPWNSDSRFRAIFDGAAIGIALFDTSGRPLEVNTSFRRMLGYSLEDLRRAGPSVCPHTEDAIVDPRPFNEMAAGKRDHHHVERRFLRNDGSVLWVRQSLSLVRDARGQAEYIIATAEDVTERRRMEESLRRSEERFRSLIENALDVIVIIAADGTIRYESPAIERVLGYTPQELMGQDGLGFVHPDDLPNVADLFAKVVEDPEAPVYTEVRIKNKDGVWRVVEAIGRNLLDNPNVGGIVVNFRDITERRKAEDEKQVLEQQVQLAGRLAAVGQLAAGVAHELNNPLTAVQGFSQFLACRQDLDDSVRSDVETIYREAQRATKITGNLLSFARKHNPEKNLISMNEVVEKSLELHAYCMRVNNIEVVTELKADLPPTMADFHQMQQVLVNLITNAEQAMTEAHGKGKLVVKTQRAGDKIRISFTDSGPGISNEDQKRLFDPFFTTKEVGKGTGLGLSICYGLVEAHGGRLHAKSRHGRGATFVVELPIVSECQGAADRADPVEA